MPIRIPHHQITSGHNLIFKTADEDHSYYVSATGIVRPKLRSSKANWNGKNWTYDDLVFEVLLPTAGIPRPSPNAALKARNWTVYAGLNNIFDDGSNASGYVVNSGHRVDEFFLVNAQNLAGHVAKVQCRLAVKSLGYTAGFTSVLVGSGVELHAIAFKLNAVVGYY